MQEKKKQKKIISETIKYGGLSFYIDNYVMIVEAIIVLTMVNRAKGKCGLVMLQSSFFLFLLLLFSFSNKQYFKEKQLFWLDWQLTNSIYVECGGP